MLKTNKNQSYKIKIDIDKTAITKLRKELASLKTDTQQIARDINAAMKNLGKVSVDRDWLSSAKSSLTQYKTMLDTAFSSAQTKKFYKDNANEAARLAQSYQVLSSKLQQLSSAGNFDAISYTNLIVDIERYNAEVNKSISLENQAATAAAKKSKEVTASAKKIYQTQKTLTDFLAKNPQANGQKWGDDINSWLSELQVGVTTEGKINEIRTGLAGIRIEMSKAGKLGKSFGDVVAGMFQKFGGWSLVTGSMMRVSNMFRDMLTNVKNLDTAMTELRKVTNETEATYESFFSTAADRAKAVGATITDTISATADFAKQGYSVSEASELADAALVYKNVGDNISDINVASESLISTMQGFGIAADDAMFVVDKFNEVNFCCLRAQRCA